MKKTPDPSPDKELLDEAVKLINNCKKPVIYCGGGVINGNCSEYIEPLAEKCGAYGVFSMMGLTAMDCENPRHLGMSGMHGRYAATKTLTQADLVLAVGVRFYRKSNWKQSKICRAC